MAVSEAKQFTVGLLQMRCTPKPGANLEKAVAHIREAARSTT
jgi:hypothetical protein